MELLILLCFVLLVSIVVLPFVALARANAAKRSVDDLTARVASLENELRALRSGAAAPASQATIAPTMAPKPTAVPPPLPVIMPVPPPPSKAAKPPPVSP